LQQIFFKFDSVNNGFSEEKPRWLTCVAETADMYGFALTGPYVMKYFPLEAKTETEQLIKNLETTLNIMITKLDWMDESTREAALKKLNAIKQFVGYPEWTLKQKDTDTFYEGVCATVNTLYLKSS
jgi:predicted metalloendopeptidase